MYVEQEERGQDAIPDDKAEALVRRLGDGDFRNELASFPDVVRGKKVYTFSEMRQTQTVTRTVSRGSENPKLYFRRQRVTDRN